MDLNSGMPVGILEHILLQLDSPTCLIRASSACKLWRHIIAAPAFLRRSRSLHAPPVAGAYANSGRIFVASPDFKPAPPSPTTTVATRNLSLEFLPTVAPFQTWTVVDSRGSLLLLELATVRGSTRYRSVHVCEPVTGRLEEIYRLETPGTCTSDTEAFLLDGAAAGGPTDDDEPAAGRGGVIGMSNYRMVSLSWHRRSASMFTAAAGGGGSWRRLSIDNQGKVMLCMGSAAGSIYWYTNGGTVVAMDQTTAEISSSSLPVAIDVDDVIKPRSATFTKLSVATGRDGKARVLFLGASDDDSKLKIFARGEGDWVLEETVVWRPSAVITLGGVAPSAEDDVFFARPVPLSAETSMDTVQIVALPSSGRIELEKRAFDLHIETKQLKPIKYATKEYPIRLPWPPSLHACTEPAIQD